MSVIQVRNGRCLNEGRGGMQQQNQLALDGSPDTMWYTREICEWLLFHNLADRAGIGEEAYVLGEEMVQLFYIRCGSASATMLVAVDVLTIADASL